MKTMTLQRQFRLWTVLLILVPSLLVMSIYTIGQISMGKEQSLELINQRVSSQKILLNQWLNERMDNVRKLTQLEAFRTLDYPQMKRILALIQHNNSNFSSLAYIDKEGIFQLVTLNNGEQHPSLVGQIYSQGNLPEKEFISGVVIGRTSGLPIINFSFPIYDYDDNFQGILLGSVKASLLSSLLSENWIGETGEVFLVNDQGLMLNEPRYAPQLVEEGLLVGSAILNRRISDQLLQYLQANSSGTAAWTDNRGEKIIGTYLTMPEYGWTLIGRIKETEVTTPIYHQLALMASGTLFLILLFLSLGTLLTNRIKNPLDWLIEQSNRLAVENYEINNHYIPSPNTPQELFFLCETFVYMHHNINTTLGLLKENEITLESKVAQRALELSTMNTILEDEITQHKATNTALTCSRDALLLSETRYKDLFYYMQNGCAYYKVLFDAAGTPIDLEHIHVNHTYARYLGHPPSEFVGQRLTTFFPHYKDETFNWLQAYINVGISGKPASFTQFSVHYQRWFSVSAYSPAKGYVAVISKDVTHYLSLKKEVARLDRLNLIGNMAAGLAHEIRNPLTVVKGYLQYLKRKLPSYLYDQFHLVLEELGRIEEIITVFLSIAKDKPTELAKQDLNQIINGIAPLLQTDALKRGMGIDFKLSPNLPMLFLSEKEIKQLLLNLATNGLAAMKEHGTLTIETAEKDDEIILSITDSGIGIPPKLHQKIFDPFFTTRDEGTGLGLAICASIAERHNALIQVSSEEGKGSCFTIIFPNDKISLKKKPVTAII